MQRREPSLSSVKTASDFSSADLDAGRRLFTREWRFLSAASSVESLPKMNGVEIAFSGRSNVGKSSLVNALTGRNALARMSRTPGRTQELIFFTNDAGLTLVDMPGYGYAAAPKQKVNEWTELIHAFLRGRANLARVYVLIDGRHGLKDADKPALDVLSESAVSHQIVLTKSDQVKKADMETRVAATKMALAKRPAAYPELVLTSSREGAGIPELRAAVARLLSERRA